MLVRRWVIHNSVQLAMWPEWANFQLVFQKTFNYRRASRMAGDSQLHAFSIRKLVMLLVLDFLKDFSKF